MSLPYTIRPATSADAAPLADLAERTFREAFAAQNSDEDMDSHCAATYGEALQRAEIVDPRVSTLVAEAGTDAEAGTEAGAEKQLVAYAQLRRGDVADCVEAANPVELHRIYVDSRWHGRGVAHGLMAELVRIAEGQDADAIWLGVWEHNPRALAFYDKWDFREVGDQVYTVGTDRQRDLVLVRNL